MTTSGWVLIGFLVLAWSWMSFVLRHTSLFPIVPLVPFHRLDRRRAPRAVA